MRTVKTMLWLILPLSIIATPAYATRTVSSPTVTEGETRLEARFGYEWDNESASADARRKQLYLMEYDVNDWYGIRFNLRYAKEAGQANDFESVEMENRIQLIESRDYGWDGGIRLTYAHADNSGEPDEVGFVMLAEKKIEQWALRANASLIREIGSDARGSAALNLAARSLYKWDDALSFGGEIYHGFGRLNDVQRFDGQNMQAGPVLLYKFTDHWGMEVGYLAGLTKAAPDGMLKLCIRTNF